MGSAFRRIRPHAVQAYRALARDAYRFKKEPEALALQWKSTAASYKPSREHTQLDHAVRRAIARREQISPFSESLKLTSEQAYQVAATSLVRRIKLEQNGHRDASFPVGRKIGFTNRSIWPEYNVQSPNWGYMFNKSVKIFDSREDRVLGLNACHEPKIEPEIFFEMNKTPHASMNDLELLSCISSMCHGFEIVTSVFPAWKFTGEDTTIAGALHKYLIFDPKNMKLLSSIQDKSELLVQLKDFHIDLYRNGEKMDSGRGSNVLGSPIDALRFLVEHLSKQDLHPHIQPGEIITTGTLTRALSLSDGDEWHTEIRGIHLPGYRIRFKLHEVEKRIL